MEIVNDLPLRTTIRFVCRECLAANTSSLPHVLLLIHVYLAEFPGQKALNAACERGASVSVLEFLLANAAPDWKKAACLAASGGHLHVLRWMAERQDGRGAWKTDLDCSLAEAARNGHVDVVKWLLSRDATRINNLNAREAMMESAYNGHLEVLKSLCERDSQTYITPLTMQNVTHTVAGHGHLEMLQWLYQHQGYIEDNTLAEAAKGGNLEMVQWLYKLKPERLTSRIVSQAAEHGHLAVVKWLLENGGEGCERYAFSTAALWGYWDVVEWLHHEYGFRIDSDMVDYAAQQGNVKVLEWLQERTSSRSTDAAMKKAAANGHLSVVQWLHSNQRAGCTTEAMDRAAENGHLSVVRWLHQNRSEGCTANAMDWACKNGHLDVVQWLRENRSEGCTQDAIQFAWREHGVKVVRWLYDNCVLRYDPITFIGAANSAVLRGNLEVMQEFQKRGLFRHQGCLAQITTTALEWGKVRILEWLLGLGYRLKVARDKIYLVEASTLESVIIEVDVQKTLQILVIRGHIEMVWWLSGRGCFLDSKFIELAAKYGNVALMRWLIESEECTLDVSVAAKVATEHLCRHVEVLWWLSESDRVSVVCRALQSGPRELIRWVLENTRFEEQSSRRAICDAVQSASEITVAYLRRNLKICNWVFETVVRTSTKRKRSTT